MLTAQQIKEWVAAPTDQTALQVPRALVVSVLAAGLDFGLLVLLVERFAWSPVAAAVVSYLLGGVPLYALCVCWVFPAAPRTVTVGIAAFTVLSLVGLGITWGTIALLHEHVGVSYVVAKVVSLGLAFAWNFLSRKYLLFVERPLGVVRTAAQEGEFATVGQEDLEHMILQFASIVAPEADRPGTQRGSELPALTQTPMHVEA